MDRGGVNSNDGGEVEEEEGGASQQPLTAAQKKRMKKKAKKLAAATTADGASPSASAPADSAALTAAAAAAAAAAVAAAADSPSSDDTARAPTEVDQDPAKDIRAGVIRRKQGERHAHPNGFRVLRYLNGGFPAGQSVPPKKPVASLLRGGTAFPAGDMFDYVGTNDFRTSSAEKRALENLRAGVYNDLRHAAEVHRQVRKFMQSVIKPGVKLFDMCEQLEDTTRRLLGNIGLNGGVGFPTGCSLNHVAAHYTPNSGDNTVLQYGDVMKLDFGTHVNGRIVDCAFTVAFDPKYDKLLEAVQASTYTGIRMAGIDARLCDIGDAIQEVMESYEVELGGKVYPVKPLSNLCGHSIGVYVIHGGKSVPIVRGGEAIRMEEGEQYAIETFGSIRGRGRVNEDLECSHYAKNTEGPAAGAVRVPAARQLLQTIQTNFGTLPFCRRYLDRAGATRYAMSLKQLCDSGHVRAYPPLCEASGAIVAQWEHTFILKETCKEVLSVGEDF